MIHLPARRSGPFAKTAPPLLAGPRCSGKRRLLFEPLESRRLLDGTSFLEEGSIPGRVMLQDVDDPARLVGEVQQPDPAFRAASTRPTGLTVVLKKGPNLSANAAASTALDQAASIVESLFDDPVTVVVDAEIAAAEKEDYLAKSEPVEFSLDYDGVRSRIVDDADPEAEAIVSRLPTSSQLKLTLPDSSFSFSGSLRMTRANLLAVGVPPADLPDGQNSQYDPAVKRDMSITFNSRYAFDYTRSDGISSNANDFVAVAVHEMLHGLGFMSTVETVDSLLDNPADPRSVEPTSLDLFRLVPGQGSANFTMAPRVLAPGSFVPQQVVYDGGVHDFRAAGYAGITVGDIPVATGTSHGDGHHGAHFKDNDKFSNKLNIGIMDPVMFATGVQIEVQSPDVRMLGLIGWDVADPLQTTLFQTDFTGGLPGDWTISGNLADGKTWTSTNPTPQRNPLSGTFMTVDSQWAGSVDMDESLISPSVDLSDYRNTTLQFTHYFRRFSTEKADVEVRVNGGSWQNVARYQTVDASGNVSLDVSAIADAQPAVQFRWRYWDANQELYWQVDNVRLSADPFSWPVKKNAKFAVVDNLVDDLFGYAADGNHVSRGFLAAGATDPRGVANTADGLKTWVLNYNNVVYVHDGEGEVLGSWTASQLKAPTGIAASGSDIWIVDKGTDTVYRFAGAAGATSGELTASSSFKLNAGNATPEGLATDGTTLWVVDGDKLDRVFVYDTAGASLGSWSIDPANTSPTGIAIDLTGASQSIWIVDISKARVYEYVDARSCTSGSLFSAKERTFALASANASPHDIAVLGVNTAPRLNAIGPQSIAAETELSFSISAADEGLSGNALAYAASDLPPGAMFDPATHTFRWMPVMSQAPGTYLVTFSVTDGVAFASEEVVIRVFDPYPWQNHANPPDADGSGLVSPLDALVIINRINVFGSGLLPSRQPDDPYFDVNRDGRVGPDDTLTVINYLNAEPEAEGESAFSEAGGEFRPSDLGQIWPAATAGTAAGLTSGSEIEVSSPSFNRWANKTGREVSEPKEFLLSVLARSRSRVDWQAAADRLLSEPDGFQSLERWM